MLRHLIFTLAFAFSLGLFAQSNDSAVLLKIDDKEVTKAEFETIFKKNNRDSVITKEDLNEYLELFINFKLKVAEAEEMGMDTLASFKKELRGYRDQLAKPYLADKSMTDSLVQEAYRRMQKEVRASHILIKLPPDPSPEDTVTAYKEVMAIKKQLKGNEDNFETVARKRSQDPSAKSNKGDLGYFSAMQMVYPFENAVYNTEVGSIGGPVRTQYGYHLVKVTDKRDARGKVRVAHIMIRSEESDPEEVQESTKKRANEVYKRLQDGEDFALMAKKFSDDRSSSNRGGELPVFGAGKMVKPFEDAAYRLENEGDITEPVKTPYGWHIIKLIEKVPQQSFDDMEKTLRNKVSKDSRSSVSQKSFIAKRKKEYNFSEDRRLLKPFTQGIDTTYYYGSWKPSEKLQKKDKTIFTLDGKEYTQSDFLDFLLERMRPRRKMEPIDNMVNTSYDSWVSQTVMDYEDSRLEEKYPEFRALINEYRDGILLFDLTDEKVWSKAVEDSAGLRNYYDSHMKDFMWYQRAEYDLYTVENEDAAKDLRKMLRKGKGNEKIKEKLNTESALGVRIESGLNERSGLPILEKIDWEEGVSETINDDGQLKIVQINKIHDKEAKEFEEARGLVTAAYQDALEKEWIEKLRAEHEIEVNKDVLYTIKK